MFANFLLTSAEVLVEVLFTFLSGIFVPEELQLRQKSC